ncbi:predicted protein [Streptomyces sp. AA4]|nr:predicted protein [Streptomyces sp. AA4]
MAGLVRERARRLGDAPGNELRDLTVGVLGTGRIGTAVVNRLRASVAASSPATSAPAWQP